MQTRIVFGSRSRRWRFSCRRSCSPSDGDRIPHCRGPRVATVAGRARRWSDPVRDLSRERRFLRTCRLHRLRDRRSGPDRSGEAPPAPAGGELGV